MSDFRFTCLQRSSILPHFDKNSRCNSLIQGCNVFVFIELFALFAFITSYGLANGLETNLSFYHISILHAGPVFGHIVSSFLADKFQIFNVQLIFTSTMAISVLGIWNLPTLPRYLCLQSFMNFQVVDSSVFLTLAALQSHRFKPRVPGNYAI
jgi:hypothetical protein